MRADTVIVGAGSSGAVIAARATENRDRDVLLIEAGPDYPDPAGLPEDLRNGRHNSMWRHDWGYKHRPTPRQMLFHFPRGRVVGGSSAVNTCIALRGQPYDYDEWAALGLPDWGWDKCLPAFKRLENDLDIKNEWHSQTGPTPIRRHRPSELVPWQAAFVDTCERLGYAECADTNDPRTTGYGPHAMNKIDGERMSAGRCYLTPEVRRRENLRILARTLVRRVRVQNRRVIGLELDTDGRVWDLAASRVILSGGALATPGILVRSGIGPREAIARIGVELVADVPGVGARLLDHPGAAIFLRPKWGVSSTRHPLIQTVLRYTSGGSECPNDMQLQPGSFVPFKRFEVPFVIISCCVGKPRGQGRLEFVDANPRVLPRIESNIFQDSDDRATGVAAMLLAWRFARQAPMKRLASLFWPSERVLGDRDTLAQFLWRMSGSGYHPCGTVPMGAENDPTAAVDAHGKVRGVEGLWVADASIMPTVPSANTNLPTLMIGERFGEWVRDGAIA
jgi:choline dehydrogenase